MKVISSANDLARLDALQQYHILDTEAEAAFDDLVQLAAEICRMPIAFINFNTGDRQWLKAKIGLEISEFPIEVGFCAFCLQQRDVVIIPDTQADPRWATDPAVLQYPQMRFYGGVPLINPEGHAIGTFCVADCIPRQLEPTQIEALRKLAHQVINQLELRRTIAQLAQLTQAQQQSQVEQQQNEAELLRQHRRTQLFSDITLKIRRSLQLDEILQTTVIEVQNLLTADRVLIFRLLEDGSGKVVQEAVVPDCISVLGKNLLDECFAEQYQEKYRQGRVSAIENIETANIQPCHREFLQQFAVKANLVVPILIREDLWGLLIVHQCHRSREWTQFELELLLQLANQIGIALSQAQLLEQETKQRQELARSNAELEQFAYVTSHDLQEPLRMVTSYLQLLERRYKNRLDAEADEFIAYAVNGAARMQALIHDLLSFSRVSTRGQPFQSVDCETIFAQVIANLKLAIEDIQATITHDRLPQVWGDPTQLAQVFQNLIANALKFRTDQPTQIHVGVRQVDQSSNLAYMHSERGHDSVEWLFWVQDNGIGIDPEYHERIFIIFQRLHGQGRYPGTGIGLAICKKIIERHGGRIWVESEAGQGATFYFTLPTHQEHET